MIGPSQLADALRHLGWPALHGALRSRLRSELARVRADRELQVALTTPSSQADREAVPLFAPLHDVHAARRRLEEQAGLERLLDVAAELRGLGDPRAALHDLEDLGPSLEVAARGSTLAAVELAAVADLLRAAAILDRLLRRATGDATEVSSGVAAIGELLAGVVPIPELLEQLERCLEDGEESPRVSDRASEALRRARADVARCRKGLGARADRLLRREGLARLLRDQYWTERDGRVVLPLRSDGLGQLGAGAIIHGSSGSGGTLFVEPAELVAANNELRSAEVRARAEERRVLELLSAAAGAEARTLLAIQDALVRLDAVSARLELGRDLGGLAPRLVDARPGGEPLTLPGARHPLMVLDGVDVVENDLTLAQGHALVISGPNAGGKTVALKTVGLCVLAATAGLRIPTRTPATIPLFRHVVTDVGDDQSISANLSTFSAHLAHVRDAVVAAGESGPSTLVLFDEIAVGTDPDQGAALAEAILHHLVQAGATVFVTTHYDRLKLLAAAAPGEQTSFVNAAVGFDLERLRPTFRVTVGVPGASSAIAVARRLGLDEAIVAEAERILGDEQLGVDVLMQQLADERARLEEVRVELERERDRLAARNREVQAREAKLLEGARSRKAKAFDAASRELRALEGELKRKRKALRQVERREDLGAPSELVAPAEQALAAHREASPVEPGAPPERLEPGARVRVVSLDAEGEVVAVKGKKVTVQLPHLRTTVALADLRALTVPVPASRSRRGTAEPLLTFLSTAGKHFGDDAVPVDPRVDNVLDVRGMRGDEAIEHLEVFLAESIARDEETVILRHGHGSGILRRLLRERLDELGHVRRHRAGLPAEGGDAVTVVWVEG